MEGKAEASKSRISAPASASSAGIVPSQRVQQLTRPPAPNFISPTTSAAHNEQAKALLNGQKTSQNSLQPPGRQLRHRFSLVRLKEFGNRSVTKTDVAIVFDNLVNQRPLPPPGLAQAVLNHAPGTSVDELWRSLAEAASPTASISPTVPTTPWLDSVTRGEYLDYIHLICHTGVSQSVRDNALSLALSRYSMPIVELLLRYGACASSCKDLVRERVKSDNVRLARLLLAAPSAMAVEDWQYCLKSRTTTAPSVLALCLVHLPGLTSAKMLLEAVESANLPAIAIMLRNLSAADDLQSVSVEACRRAHVIKSDETRYEILTMLAEAGMVRDTAFLQRELARAVRLRRVAVIRVLINAGVSLNANGHNALGSAVAGMAFEILESFVGGDSTPPLGPAMDHVPDSASEQDILQLLTIFRDHMGDPSDPLHRQLIRAVQAQRTELVQKLLGCGAAVDFQQSEAVKQAICKVDFNVLRALLDTDRSQKILSEVMPTALSLEEGPSRHEMVLCLLNKGSVSPRTLAECLCRLVSASGTADFKLIRLLLERKAPLTGYGDDASNCILICTRNGNLPLLQVLCAADPPRETLSAAVPVAFRKSKESNYKVALGIMVELLRNGAEGTLVHKTLLDAATHDRQLHFVRALLRYNGDANYKAGAAFVVALEKESHDLLRLMCKACPPSRSTLENVLPRALEPRRYEERTLKLLLSSAEREEAAVALSNSWKIANVKDNPYFASIVPCLLEYGLDVNVESGCLLPLAIQKHEVDLLQTTLSARPNTSSLTVGLSAAAALPAKTVRLKMMEVVLSQAGSSDIGQSKLLAQQTLAAVAGNALGLKLLLRYRASVDFDSGKAIQIAAGAGCLEVLDLLIGSKPVWSSLSRACHIVLSSSLESKQKQEVFQRLLDGTTEKTESNVSELLAYSLTKYPKCTELPALLLAYGAEPDLETCQVALQTVSFGFYSALIDNIRCKGVAAKVFTHVVRASLPTAARYRIYEGLLKKGVATNEVSAALVHYLKADGVADISMLELFLKHGADVGYGNGIAFRLSLLSAGSTKAFKLLVENIKDDLTAGVAFATAQKAAISQDQRMTIYRSLLMTWNIPGPQETLVMLLKKGPCDSVVLQMLLRNGADPNMDSAQCFILACTANAESEFRALSSKAEMGVVAKALMTHFRTEGQTVRWLNLCLEERPLLTKSEDGNLLFECMRTFPKGTALLKLLLDNGVSASATTLHSVSEDLTPEPCTALVWALSAKPRVDNETICTLLDRGGKSALPAYSTPSSQVSAAFLCLLDRSRTDVLKALLRLEKPQIMSCETPGRSFEHLAISPAKADPASSDFTASLPLHLAAVFLGNFECFRLISRNRFPNDGLLHTAALFALPEFVEWCLKTDDPNARDDNFLGRIPLAVACDARFMPCCRIGNRKDFRTRQKETMAILAARTDPTYREKHKTILHIALHSGPATTSAMLEALDVASDSDKHTKYLYTDQEGKRYSLREYVMEIMGCDLEQKEALLACLLNAGYDSMPGSWPASH